MKSSWHHLYKTRVWLDLRAAQLSKEPLCEFHKAMGKIVEAGVVDHKVPHKGDEELFFDSDNLQSLCDHCHNKHKAIQESTGVLPGGDTNGFPLDPNHPWNK